MLKAILIQKKTLIDKHTQHQYLESKTAENYYAVNNCLDTDNGNTANDSQNSHIVIKRRENKESKQTLQKCRQQPCHKARDTMMTLPCKFLIDSHIE